VGKMCHIHEMMRTVMTQEFSVPLLERSVAAVGNFDGVHRGHRELFRRVTDTARGLGLPAVVVTFDPHPLRVLRPDDRRFCLITTAEQKRDLIAENDIDLLLVIPFTPAFAELSAERFVREVLHGFLGVQAVVIGHDYAFGKGREGNERFLVQLGSELGFSVTALDPVGEGGCLFSSSAVRKLVGQGAVAEAQQILGRCHRIGGQVVHGREIGRSIGFPTANIITGNELIPADGVYAVWVEVAGTRYMGACSIGINPTFAGGSHTIEVFLFDFCADLYGQELIIHFVDRLRAVERFPDLPSLLEQINADVTRARQILAAGLPAEIRL